MKSKNKLGSAPNMKAAANALKLPLEMLSEAKNLGCRAFTLRGSVDLDGFAKWLEGQPEFKSKWEGEGAVPVKSVSDAWKAHFEKEWRRIRVQKELRKLIARTDRLAQFRTFCEAVKTAAEDAIKDQESFTRFCATTQNAARIFESVLTE